MREKSLLFIHRGALGDFVLALPLLRALKSAGYRRRVVITLPGHADLAAALGLAEGALDCEGPIACGFLSCQAGAAEALAAKWGSFDLVAGLISDSGNAFEQWCRETLGIPVRIVFPKPPREDGTHAVDYLFNTLGMPYLKGRPLPYPDFWMGGDALLVHPGSGSLKKNFSPHLFLNIQSRFKPAEFVLGPVEIEEGGLWPGSPLCPPSPTALASLLTRARALVSNDSGVAHLAAFLGVPTLALFKTTSPSVWQPLGRRVEILNRPEMNPEDASSALHELFSYKPAPDAHVNIKKS